MKGHFIKHLYYLALVNYVLIFSLIYRIPVERFTVGGHGFPFSAPMFLGPQHHPPVPASTAPSPLITPPYPNRMAPPVGVPTFNFSQADVDSVLYGYTKNRDKRCNGHAISNLRIGDLSHGKYRYTISYSLTSNSILFLFWCVKFCCLWYIEGLETGSETACKLHSFLHFYSNF